MVSGGVRHRLLYDQFLEEDTEVVVRGEKEARKFRLKEIRRHLQEILYTLGRPARMGFLEGFTDEDAGEVAVVLFVPGQPRLTQDQKIALAMGIQAIPLKSWPPDSTDRPLLVYPDETVSATYLIYVALASEAEIRQCLEEGDPISADRILESLVPDRYKISHQGILVKTSRPN